MASCMFTAIITGLVLVITWLLNSTTKILKIIFNRRVQQTGAVEIDTKEHIYSHPDYTNKLKEFSSIGKETLYDVLRHGLKLGGDRPLFSFRNSSQEKFQSYSYK